MSAKQLAEKVFRKLDNAENGVLFQVRFDRATGEVGVGKADTQLSHDVLARFPRRVVWYYDNRVALDHLVEDLEFLGA